MSQLKEQKELAVTERWSEIKIVRLSHIRVGLAFHQLFCIFTILASNPPLWSGLEAFSWAKAARVSGRVGGVAGVFVGTHDYRGGRRKERERGSS